MGVNGYKKISRVFSIVALAVGVCLLGLTYSNSFAATTLLGNNEIITIKSTDGLALNAALSTIAYSDDGNVVLFTSSATNLPNSSGSEGLYVYNIKDDVTSRVDISTSGVLPDNVLFLFAPPQLSETGRYVTFASYATNLIDGSINPTKVIYKRDTQTNTTIRIGAGNTSGYSDKWDRNLAVSNDGRFSLVSSRYLANGYPNNYGIALGDSASGTYSWTSVGMSSGGGYNDATAGGMSCDGGFVVFKRQYDIHVSDIRRGGSVVLIAGNSTSTSPMISCNGRYILYATTNRTNITPTPPGMVANHLQLVRYDRITGERIYINSDSSGVFSSDGFTYSPSLFNQQPNVFKASVADTGDVVFQYNGYMYLKHLSDNSGTLESIAKNLSGMPVNVNNGTIVSGGRYIFFNIDPYSIGLAPSPSSSQLIRTRTNL